MCCPNPSVLEKISDVLVRWLKSKTKQTAKTNKKPPEAALRFMEILF